MYSRQIIYEACMKLRPKASEGSFIEEDSKRRIFFYDDPFDYGLRLEFWEDDDRLSVMWVKSQVFIGIPSKDRWGFEHGIWEEYLIMLALYNGDAATIKSRCRSLEVYSHVANYEQRMLHKVFETALLIIKRIGKEKNHSTHRSISAKKTSDRFRAIVEISYRDSFVSHRHVLDINISQSNLSLDLPKYFRLTYSASFHGVRQVNNIFDYSDVTIKRHGNYELFQGGDKLEALFDWGDELLKEEKNNNKSRMEKIKREKYCKVLNVSDNATKEEIKRAYHRLALQYHPDGYHGQKWAEEKFKEVTEAYRALISN